MRMLAGLGKKAPWEYRPRVPGGGRTIRLGLGRPSLSQGQLSQEPVSDAALRPIRQRIASILSAAGAQLDQVLYEVDLALDPATARSVPVVGSSLTRNEILALEIQAATEIREIAESVARSAGSYWNGEHEAALVRLGVRVADLIESIPDADVAPILAENRIVAQTRIAEVTESLREMKQALEREIVELEAQAVPVREPARVPWAYVGIAAAGIVVLSFLLSGE